MEVSIDEPLNVDWDGNELLLSDILGTEEDIDLPGSGDWRRRRNCLITCSQSAVRQEKSMIVQLRFGLGHPDGEEKTQKEVADILGISQSYISRLEKKIMIRLKRELDRYEV